MDYLQVRNWDRWQSYRSDRSQPPWIKLHRCLMRNQDWVALTDAQRGQLVSIWLLAADRQGNIPKDPKIIKKLCFMDSEPDIELFIEHGFIELDATVTPERRQDDAKVTHQTRLDKTRLDKTRRERSTRFAPPSLEEVTEYCQQRDNKINPNSFIDYYEANGWFRGKTKIKDWKACIRTWETREKGNGTKPDVFHETLKEIYLENQ